MKLSRRPLTLSECILIDFVVLELSKDRVLLFVYVVVIGGSEAGDIVVERRFWHSGRDGILNFVRERFVLSEMFW